MEAHGNGLRGSKQDIAALSLDHNDRQVVFAVPLNEIDIFKLKYFVYNLFLTSHKLKVGDGWGSDLV